MTYLCQPSKIAKNVFSEYQGSQKALVHWTRKDLHSRGGRSREGDEAKTSDPETKIPRISTSWNHRIRTDAFFIRDRKHGTDLPLLFEYSIDCCNYHLAEK